MEQLGGQKDLFCKMSNFSQILKYYDYAYESVLVLRTLCKESRDVWLSQPEVIARMFEKQIIHIENNPIDENTIKMLKRGNRYMLFKLDITIDSQNQDRLSIFYQMLEEMPEFEIFQINVWQCSNELVNTLAKKSNFKTKQDLFKVLQTGSNSVIKQSEPHEYLASVCNPESLDMSCFVKQANLIQIQVINDDMNIDCMAEKVEICAGCVQNIEIYKLGTENFYNSVTAISIDYFDQESRPLEDLDVIHKYFKNLKYVDLKYIGSLEADETIEILTKHKISHISTFYESDSIDRHWVESEDGCLVFHDKNHCFVNYKRFRLQCDDLLYRVQNEYVFFYFDGNQFELDLKEVVQCCKDYDCLNLDKVEESVIILHKKYIHKLTVDSFLLGSIRYEPTKCLNLCFRGQTFSNLETLEEYLSSRSFNHLHIALNLHMNYNKDIFQVIFDHLNIKELTVNDSRNKFEPEFYVMIRNCNSLRSVYFESINDTDALLDAVEENQNVKQWILYFSNDFTESIEKRVKQILIDRNDISLIAYSKEKDGYYSPQLMNQFIISPVSFY